MKCDDFVDIVAAAAIFRFDKFEHGKVNQSTSHFLWLFWTYTSSSRAIAPVLLSSSALFSFFLSIASTNTQTQTRINYSAWHYTPISISPLYLYINVSLSLEQWIYIKIYHHQESIEQESVSLISVNRLD